MAPCAASASTGYLSLVRRTCDKFFLPTRRITIRYERTWPWARMRLWVGRSSGPVSLSPSQSCLGCTTITSGYEFRKGQIHANRTKVRWVSLCVWRREHGTGNLRDGVIALTGRAIYRLRCSCMNAPHSAPGAQQEEQPGAAHFFFADLQMWGAKCASRKATGYDALASGGSLIRSIFSALFRNS